MFFSNFFNLLPTFIIQNGFILTLHPVDNVSLEFGSTKINEFVSILHLASSSFKKELASCLFILALSNHY